MKTALMLALLAAAVPQDKDPDKIEVTVDLQDASFSDLFQMLTRLSGIPIELGDAAKKEIDPDKERISVKLSNMPLSGALKLMLAPRGLEATLVDKKKLVVSRKGS